jgi:CHAT domain-containing protein
LQKPGFGKGFALFKRVFGLLDAVFVAGVPTTVVSQWNVESKSTSELMIEFHRALRQNSSKAKALQTAAISLLKNKRTNQPYFWAGFVLIGKP